MKFGRSKTLAAAAALATALSAQLAPLQPSAAAAAPAPIAPPLLTPVATLENALTCTSDLATAGQTPILLVPGTVESSNEAYSWGYQKVLRDQGHPLCWIDRLPSYGLTDVQPAAEYVVYAVRKMYAVSGRRVSLLAHSQGGMLEAWAMRFYPDLADMVDDVVSLESPYSGGAVEGPVWCAVGSCPGFAWQASPSSNALRALARNPLPAGISYTSIGSMTDELNPGNHEAFNLPGATTIIIQDLCPGRVVDHISSLADAVGYAIAMDALDHLGPAAADRVDRSVCAQTLMPGADVAGMTALIPTFADIALALTNPTYYEPAEPMVRPGAAGDVGDTNLALGRPVVASSTQPGRPASAAVDGDLGTRWASQWWHDPEWIRVDLGAVKTVTAVQLRWDSAYASAYQVQVSADGATWTTAYPTTAGRGHSELVFGPDAPARFVRILGTARASLLGGYSLDELQVIGH